MLTPSIRQGHIPEPLLTIRVRVFSVERKIAIALMHLATGCTLTIVSEKFGCGTATVSKIMDDFIDAMLPYMCEIIKWPATSVEVHNTKVGMERAQGFPNCMGAIDCTHIKMERPPNELASNWYDRKGNYSMTLQGVVDANMRFLDIFVGFPGPANDKRVLQNSSFFRLAQANQRLHGPLFSSRGYSVRDYIIGDGGYYHLPWLLIPFLEPCSPSQSRYNFRLSSSRIVVERAFGRLKNAWRILDGVIKNPNVVKVPKVMAVCCMLHNLAIDHGMAVDNEVDRDLAAYTDHNGQHAHVNQAISAETVTMYMDELHGTHL
ncbi:hypothetical protein L7F22_044516 [Adiantum nelumboides]|nr:hypothetical protein [Adiantum nelumboides]